jgi:uncharacterized membrane protein YfcA
MHRDSGRRRVYRDRFLGELLSLPPLIVGSMLGAWFGVRLQELAPQRVIRYGFAIFMVLAAALTLADAVP